MRDLKMDITRAIRAHLDVVEGLLSITDEIQALAHRMTSCIKSGGKILWMGNGGSAADCQHLAAELVGRFARERRGLPSIALTTDTSILTAVGNDYGYDTIFSRQVESLCGPSDVVVGISTSGNSRNVLAGVERAREIGAFTAGLSGRTGGKLKDLTDLCIVIPSCDTARIQEGHILIGHILCDWIESSVVGSTD
jgi:D-sedoheptulose 7-phosphate isomerase